MTAPRPDDESIFHAARGIADADSRRAYVREACAGDEARVAHVEALLAAADGPDSLLDRPAGSAPAATVDPPPAAEAPGTVIGPYKLLQQVGEGGMGVVWTAQQTEPVKRVVAVKLIKAGMDSKQVIARFEAERQALALMDHPNIARVTDAGTTGAGRPYFVMDLVKGAPITRYCDDHRLTPRQRLELFLPVCQAIHHAHQKGVIHRDIKPSNVLVALDDGKPVPKVIDFGVAKAAGQSLTDKTLVTGFGAIVGTLEYMSPEQAEINQLDVDTRSDIYSLGVLLYELLTGSPPFSRTELDRAGMLEMLRVIREQEPSKPSTKLSTAEGLPTLAANRGTEPARLTKMVRGELDWIVMKALEKERSRRYETANGFAMDVQRYLADERVQACPPSARYRFRKFAQRNRGALLTVSAVSLALVLGTGVSIWQAVRARQAEQDATKQRNVAQVQRRFARQAVDKMFTQVAENWLSRDVSLEFVQRKILLDALQIYEDLAKEDGDDPTLRLERGNAYRRIGEIHHKFGNHAEADRAFQKALEILGRLVDENASEPDYRSALATAYHHDGVSLHYSMRQDEALGVYRQALVQRTRLAEENPHVPRYVRDFAVSLGAVCNLETGLGAYSDAEAGYRRAIQLLEALPKEEADDPDCRFELGLMYSELALVMIDSGRVQKSPPLLDRGTAIYEQLVREFPHNPTYLDELAWALYQEGWRLGDRPQDAETAFRRAVAFSEQLARESPRVAGYRVGVARCHYGLGCLLMRTGRRAQAEEALRLAAGTIEQQLKDFPDRAPGDFSGVFRSSHSALQTLLLEDGRRKDAEAVYHRAVQVNGQLSRTWTKTTDGRWNLALFRWELAKLASRYGWFDDAARYSGEAIKLHEQIAAERPNYKAYQETLAARKAEQGKLVGRAKGP
jgi:serine/threonine protein kinase